MICCSRSNDSIQQQQQHEQSYGTNDAQKQFTIPDKLPGIQIALEIFVEMKQKHQNMTRTQ